MNRPVFPVSATIRTWRWLVLAGGGWQAVELAVRYGVWKRAGLAPILVDTGYGFRTCVSAERSTPLKLYGGILRPRLNPDDLLTARLARFGCAPKDVQLTILTHFHPDHVDGLKDLPTSRFLVSREIWEAASRLSWPRRVGSGIFRELLPADFGRRLSFIEDLPRRPLLFGLGDGFEVLADGSLLAVPLAGHAPGHFGLLWPNLDPPLLYGADAQWLWQAISDDRAPWLATRLVAHDKKAARVTMARLRSFAATGGEVVLCHDPSPGNLYAAGRMA